MLLTTTASKPDVQLISIFNKDTLKFKFFSSQITQIKHWKYQTLERFYFLPFTFLLFFFLSFFRTRLSLFPPLHDPPNPNQSTPHPISLFLSLSLPLVLSLFLSLSLSFSQLWSPATTHHRRQPHTTAISLHPHWLTPHSLFLGGKWGASPCTPCMNTPKFL